MIRPMTATGLTVFDTAIGHCGLAWGGAGIVGVELPQGDAARTLARMARRYPAASEAEPPAEVAAATQAIVSLMAGEPVDLTGVRLDLSGAPDFNLKVWEIARAIPPGETLTYGDIARRLGDVSLSQQVGQALGRNPCPIIVPCHRVLAAGGKTGGFSANGGVDTKLRMLTIEKARSDPAPSLFDDLPLAAKPHRA